MIRLGAARGTMMAASILLICLFFGSSRVVPVNMASASSKLLKQCLNRNQPAMKVNSWKHAMSDRMSAIQVADVWWSDKAAAVPMTIITHVSIDRIGQLAAQVGSIN